MIKVAINGYGRIGRVAHRVILERYQDQIEVVAINAGKSTDIKGWMYLLKYDSSYGPIYSLDVTYQEKEENSPNQDLIGYILIDNKKIPVFSQKDPTLLPWKDLGVDVVIESTGHFTTEEKLKTHLQAGAKAVILSAPAKEGNVPTYVVSLNSDKYQGENIINNASCTTNCIAPVAKVIVDTFGVEKAMMTTIHGYTSDQELHDGGHKDYRRARAAATNIVPTSTGATIAAGQVVPELTGVFGGLSVRVPVAVGSLADFTFILKRETTKDEINDALRKAAKQPQFSGILAVTDDPIVSSDIIGSPYSSIVDLSLTQVIGNMAKVIAWYDNEYGYSNRLIEEVVMVGGKLGQAEQISQPQEQVLASQQVSTMQMQTEPSQMPSLDQLAPQIQNTQPQVVLQNAQPQVMSQEPQITNGQMQQPQDNLVNNSNPQTTI
jgi:glyceraldehyde 3-phosphate dehydrogenase